MQDAGNDSPIVHPRFSRLAVRQMGLQRLPCFIRQKVWVLNLAMVPDGAPVCKFPAPHFEFPAFGNEPRHGDLAVRRAGPPLPGGCHEPRPPLGQELEAKQTLLDQLRALAAEDPDFFTDLIEGETNLLELIAASSSAGSSSIPSSRSVSRPCARPPRRSPSQRRASRPSLSPPKTSPRAGGSRSRPHSIRTDSPRQSAPAPKRSRRPRPSISTCIAYGFIIRC